MTLTLFGKSGRLASSTFGKYSESSIIHRISTLDPERTALRGIWILMPDAGLVEDWPT